MRAFTSADIVQHDTGTTTGGGSTTPALPTASADGNGGIIIMGAATQIDPPEQWDYAAQTGPAAYGATFVTVLDRAGLVGGESSWTLTSVGTPNWLWVAEEWTNLSYVAVEDGVGSGLLSAPASASPGTTGSFTTEYVVGVAALLVIGGGTGATAWSGVTWSNSFDETEVLQIGTGAAGAATAQLRVARRYGTQGETGPWTTTATFTGGTQTGKTAYACLAVLRAESWDTDV